MLRYARSEPASGRDLAKSLCDFASFDELNAHPRDFGIRRLIDRIVQLAAIGVHERRIVTARLGQKPRRHAERSRVPSQALTPMLKRVDGARHGSPCSTAAARIVDGRTSSRATASEPRGTTRSSTRAEDKTPGTPAPGCVPAPTKYSPPTSSETL